ncbi:MAG: 50S ribosomal protein L7/L12, partial [Patescibacteria group bacterium]
MDSEEKTQVPERFKSLIETIEQMNVLELAELVKVLEAKFGVSAIVSTIAPTNGGA